MVAVRLSCCPHRSVAVCTRSDWLRTRKRLPVPDVSGVYTASAVSGGVHTLPTMSRQGPSPRLASRSIRRRRRISRLVGGTSGMIS
eukprot:scaffold1159_cov215-Pinguiococcus_pyrenoidosus.AAC.22